MADSVQIYRRETSGQSGPCTNRTTYCTANSQVLEVLLRIQARRRRLDLHQRSPRLLPLRRDTEPPRYPRTPILPRQPTNVETELQEKTIVSLSVACLATQVGNSPASANSSEASATTTSSPPRHCAPARYLGPNTRHWCRRPSRVLSWARGGCRCLDGRGRRIDKRRKWVLGGW